MAPDGLEALNEALLRAAILGSGKERLGAEGG